MAKKADTTYETLWNMVDGLKCFKTKQKDFLVEVNISNRVQIYNIKSDDFKSWAIYELGKLGHLISTEDFNHIVDRLTAKIWAMDKEIEIHTRIVGNSKAIYYDLCDKSGRIVKITPTGYTIITSDICRHKFQRNDNMLAQVEPISGDDRAIFRLKEFYNIKSVKSFHLFLVYVISCFIPFISHPILTTVGSHGAAKTTGNRLTKRIVDPTLADVVSMPKDKRDLIVQLNRGYMLFFDNIGRINDDFNDILCQSSTGGYQIARKLYTDNDIVAYKLQRCLMLNGMAELTDKADLLDRSISVRLERIDETKRMTESALFQSFDKEIPYFLHSIFITISKAMTLYKSVKLDRLPRMADFAIWGYAIAEALEIGGDNFIKEYERNQKGIGLELLQSNATATGILDFMKDKTEWKGSVREFWKELDVFAIRTDINRYDPTWARNENSLGKKLEELKVNLEQQGIRFDKRNVGTHKELSISKRNTHKNQ